MIRYREINQWRVYNPRIRKIHVLASVSFDESFSYYNTGYEIIYENDNCAKLENI